MLLESNLYRQYSNNFLLSPASQILFDDIDSQQFMCMCCGSATALAYQLLKSGAAKADMWRLAVTHRYGGIYLDTDATCSKNMPFSSYVWPNASLVTGIGQKHDFHQWVLAYAPKHRCAHLSIYISFLYIFLF